MFTTYESRLQEALEKQEKIKAEIDFLRLQIKQERQQTRWCNSSPFMKQFRKQWPDARIDNGAGLTYISLDFGVLDPNYEEHLPGWELFDTTRIDPNSLGSPILRKYKFPGIPAHLYVTKAVR